MKLRITNFHAVSPKHRSSQTECLSWLAAAHERARPEMGERDRFIRLLERYGCSSRQIGFRSHEVPDFRHENFEEMLLFRPEDFPNGAPMERRMECFQQGALRAFQEWYPLASSAEVDNLIHVSCTGYLAPSAAQIRVNQLGLAEKCEVTHAYHMGCYAAVPAIRIAQGFLNGKRSTSVDIAHTEMCTLHFNPGLADPEQLVVQTLFSDGMIKYQLTTNDSIPGLVIKSIREEQVPHTEKHMEWSPKSWGMGMTLSREVPQAIKGSLDSYLVRLFSDAGLDYHSEKDSVQFAIHPGGPKILDGIRDELRLRRDQMAMSGRVLYEHGNMSSATLPFIWEQYLNEREIANGTRIVSLAFGPGLTIAGILVEKENSSG